jgi:predicted transcriptional regulator
VPEKGCFHAVLITENKEIKGIITSVDIIRYFKNTRCKKEEGSVV